MRVRDLGLPRDALVNVLVRDDEALPPRGSTRLEAGDRLYVVARQGAMAALEEARERWRTGPVGPAPRPAALAVDAARRSSRRARGRRPTATPTRPTACSGLEVVERLDTRWDVPGALVVLADGRYAVTGPARARRHPRAAAVARAAAAADAPRPIAERAWWQEVIGASAL